MKQYTTPEQTAKLIELGLLPERIQSVSDEGKMLLELMGFSIGELIEILPMELEDVGINTTLVIQFEHNLPTIEYIGLFGVEYSIVENELVDALYKMIIKLKEEKLL